LSNGEFLVFPAAAMTVRQKSACVVSIVVAMRTSARAVLRPSNTGWMASKARETVAAWRPTSVATCASVRADERSNAAGAGAASGAMSVPTGKTSARIAAMPAA